MLQRDYLLEIISQFVETVVRALKAARSASDPAATLESAAEVEQEIAGLLDMDPSVAMNLTPDSLVTMIVLSGMGESLSEYVAYTLDRVSDVYRRAGEDDLAELRHAQAQAVAESFGCDPTVPPAEFAEFAEEQAE